MVVTIIVEFNCLNFPDWNLTIVFLPSGIFVLEPWTNMRNLTGLMTLTFVISGSIEWRIDEYMSLRSEKLLTDPFVSLRVHLFDS